MNYFNLILRVFVFIFFLNLFSYSFCQSSNVEIKFSPRIGISEEKTSWAISGDLHGNKPNIMSELVWNNNNIVTGIENFIFWNNFVLKTDLSTSYTYSGYGTDSDYASDNREDLIYSGKFSSKNSSSLAIKVATEYAVTRNRLYFNLGYSLISYKDKLSHGKIGSSSYRWGLKGPLLGFRYHFFNDSKWNVSIANELLFVKYHAKADWILRDDLKHPLSYSHNLSANWAMDISTVWIYNLNDKVSIGLNGKYFIYDGKRGIDTTFLKSGVELVTQLNYVRLRNWNSCFFLTLKF